MNLLDKYLIANAKSLDSKVFYLKMKGDYNRYLAEFLLDDDYNKALDYALNAYKDAEKKWRKKDTLELLEEIDPHYSESYETNVYKYDESVDTIW